MKVRYLTETALSALKSNLKEYEPYFQEDTNDSLIAKLKENLGTEVIFKDTPYFFPDEKLPYSKDSDDELYAIQLVFKTMKELPAAVAMDERLWAGIAIDLAWEYVLKRWDGKISEHFFFMHNPRRSFTRHAISRLWWLGKLTYDETLDDPYRRTRIVTKDLGYVVDLLERNFSNNRRISAEFVDAVEEARAVVQHCGAVILRPELRILCKYLNMLGGVYILDALPQGMIKRKIFEKAVKIARMKGAAEPEVEDEASEDI